MSRRPDSLLTQHFEETRRQLRGLLFKIWGGGFLLAAVGFALAWFFIQPAPPRMITMATGPTDGAYFSFANRYRQYLADNGVTLELRSTAGSMENYRLLETDSEINLAIVQGGVASQSPTDSVTIESLASLYFEPVWVFYRGEEVSSDLRAFAGKRIAVGREDSGTESITRLLLDENGVGVSDDSTLVQIGGAEAVEQLKSGEIDVAFFVRSPESALIGQLISMKDVRLLSFDRHEAYARRHAFLTAVTLERGVIDLENDLPRQDVQMIAPVANLIATSSLHDALIPLILRAATETHHLNEGLLQPGRLPSTEFIEFPLNQSAEVFFEEGPPFLQKYLPFWVASAISRGKILLLPALTLLLPLFRVAPPLYRWRIRSRIYRWYEILREIESELRSGMDGQERDQHLRTLSRMQDDLDEIKSVPLSYMEEFYNLRLHVEFVERRVSAAIEPKGLVSSDEGNGSEDQADAEPEPEPEPEPG